MNVKDALGLGKQLLKENKVEGPEASTEFLLRKILNVSKTELLAEKSRKLSLLEARKFRKWIGRRAKHEPVWYIVGEIEFYGQDFYVTEDVLIPRPETELLVEKIIKNEQKNSSKVLDVGTGSGAIILSLAANLSGHFYASDISAGALKVARRNARSLKHEVTFKEGDLLGPWVGEKFNIVIANLPYVPHEDMASLAFDLVHYEPRTALDGGEKGLEIYERFFKELPTVLAEKAHVYCEIGDKQGELLAKVVREYLPDAEISLGKDYAGFDRYLIIKS